MGKIIRVLLVEDDVAQSVACATALEDVHMKVKPVYTAQEAIDAARVEQYDMIVLDIRLPDALGFVVLRTLRDENIITPVIVLSMEDEPVFRNIGIGLGAISYLSKPIQYELLAERIELLVGGKGGPFVSDIVIP